MTPGKFEEHPMPLMVATSCFGICSSTSAFCTAARTPKSPHPGHQSGSTLPFRSAITICLGSIASVAIESSLIFLRFFRFFTFLDSSSFFNLNFSNHDLVGRHRETRVAGELFFDRFHDVLGHEWFS